MMKEAREWLPHGDLHRGTLGAIIFATVLGWYIEDVRQFTPYLGVGLGF